MQALVAGGVHLVASTSTSASLSSDWWEYVLLFAAVMASWAGVPAIEAPPWGQPRSGRARATSTSLQ